MNFERYEQLLLCEKNKDITLKTGKSYTIDFNIEDEKAADRIFMTGEVGIFYSWKTEPDYAKLYRRIDDSLSSIESENSQYPCRYRFQSKRCQTHRKRTEDQSSWSRRCR